MPRRGFNGQLSESASRHYLLGNGYRAYSPVLMRFLQPDSWSPFGWGGLNPYCYCGGEPVNQSDPSGHMPWSHLFRAGPVGKRQIYYDPRIIAGRRLSELKRTHAQAFGLDEQVHQGLSRSGPDRPSQMPSESTSHVLARTRSRRPSTSPAVPPDASPQTPPRQASPERPRRKPKGFDDFVRAIETRNVEGFNRFSMARGNGVLSMRILNTKMPPTNRPMDTSHKFTATDRNNVISQERDANLTKFLVGISLAIRRVR